MESSPCPYEPDCFSLALIQRSVQTAMPSTAAEVQHPPPRACDPMLARRLAVLAIIEQRPLPDPLDCSMPSLCPRIVGPDAPPGMDA